MLFVVIDKTDIFNMQQAQDEQMQINLNPQEVILTLVSLAFSHFIINASYYIYLHLAAG